MQLFICFKFEAEPRVKRLYKNYIKSTEHTIKLDNDIWNDIKTFFTENYSEYSIILTLEDKSTKSYADFDSAKDFIIENDSRLKKIRLFAQEGEEAIKIDYVTGMWTKQPVMSAEAKYLAINEAKINEFFKRLKKGGKAGHFELYSYVICGIYMFFLMSRAFNWLNKELVSLIMIISAIVNLIVIAAYNEIAWGRKRVIFWIDEDKKKMHMKRTKRIRGVMYASCAVILIDMAIKTFF